VKVDKKATLEELQNIYSRALPFAVEIGYVNELTLDFIIAKAALHGKALENLIPVEGIEPEVQSVEEAGV
jgi:hypothetical protein